MKYLINNLFYLSYSLVDGIKAAAANFNITYHPIFDNYNHLSNITKVPFNISHTFQFGRLIEGGKIML